MIAGSTLNCTITWGTKMSSKQSCNHYMGTICKNLLTDWHQCAISNGEIYVESNEENHVALDQEIYELQGLLGLHIYHKHIYMKLICSFL